VALGMPIVETLEALERWLAVYEAEHLTKETTPHA